MRLKKAEGLVPTKTAAEAKAERQEEEERVRELVEERELAEGPHWHSAEWTPRSITSIWTAPVRAVLKPGAGRPRTLSPRATVACQGAYSASEDKGMIH